MAGGPMVNIAIAFFLFWCVFATYGNPSRRGRRADRRRGGPECVVPVEDGRACTARGARDDPSPAAAGRPRGRATRSSASTAPRSRDWDRFQSRSGTTPTATRSSRSAATTSRLTLEPPTPPSTAAPDVAGGPDPHRGRLPRRAARSPASRPAARSTPPQQMGTMTVETVQALGQLPVKVYEVGQARSSGSRSATPRARCRIVGGGRFAGEAAASEAFPLTDKLVTLLFLIASFNFFIGMFNFVPLLPLDGGHIAGALYERPQARPGAPARSSGPGARRRRQAAAGGLRRGAGDARDGCGADRRPTSSCRST